MLPKYDGPAFVVFVGSLGRAMRIHIPANYPSETLVLFTFSTCHVLMALLISRVGVLRRNATVRAERAVEAPLRAELT
jgi:hypothetical protein